MSKPFGEIADEPSAQAVSAKPNHKLTYQIGEDEEMT
jgi:hypothetical protein